MNEINPEFEERLIKLYGNNSSVINYQKERYLKLVSKYEDLFGKNELIFISTPGRTELSGNHTDHNNGIVLAASINLDSVAACSVNSKNFVSIHSEGYDELIKVDLNLLNPQTNEEGATSSLVRGIASRFKDLEYQIGGFNAVITSDVLQGSGLSSSASIEVLIGTIFNALYNDFKIQAEVIAQIGQYSENVFFGKPCGLMDQMACAIGGIIKIDFADNANPQFEKIDFSFDEFGYQLLVVDCGEGHDNLTNEYASIPTEMKSVAKEFGKDVLRELDVASLNKNIKKLRETVGDRAVLRATHFFKENERVEKQYKALKTKNITEFLNLVNESGNSSFKYLQNIFPTSDPSNQPISLALSITEDFIYNIGSGTCRVHGGGFAGTIQVFIPKISIADYTETIESVFGKNSVKLLEIREFGSYVL
ncbi:MAG: hypothetical protein KAI45_10690 [Melioribacteraceae bacterium]|nr:hypothetical protein [Melioribacteraceae bacterium]